MSYVRILNETEQEIEKLERKVEILTIEFLLKNNSVFEDCLVTIGFYVHELITLRKTIYTLKKYLARPSNLPVKKYAEIELKLQEYLLEKNEIFEDLEINPVSIFPELETIFEGL